MQSVEEIAEAYESRTRPECPNCHSDAQVAFNVRGKPSSQLLAYSQQPNSRVKLGGCMVGLNDPNFYCKKCQTGF